MKWNHRHLWHLVGAALTACLGAAVGVQGRVEDVGILRAALQLLCLGWSGVLGTVSSVW